MNYLIATILIIGGIALLIVGFNTNNAIPSQVSRAVTGHPTDRAMWYMIGGAAALVLGLSAGFFGRKV